MLTALAGLVVAAATVALSSLIIGLFGLEGDSLQGSAEWIDVPIKMGTLLYSFLPYVMLALLATALTSSTALGITAFVVYYLIETTASPILNNFDWFQRISEYLLSPNVSAVLQASYGEVSISINGGGDTTQPDLLHAVLVLAGYTLVFGVLTFHAVPTSGHHRRQGQLGNPQIIIVVKHSGSNRYRTGSAGLSTCARCRLAAHAGTGTDLTLVTTRQNCREGRLATGIINYLTVSRFASLGSGSAGLQPASPLSSGVAQAGSIIDPKLLTPAHYCRQGPLGLRDRSSPES